MELVGWTLVWGWLPVWSSDLEDDWALVWGWLPVWSRDLEDVWALVWGWLPVWSRDLEDLEELQVSAFGHCLVRHRIETFTRLKNRGLRPLRELDHQVVQLGSPEWMVCLHLG